MKAKRIIAAILISLGLAAAGTAVAASVHAPAANASTDTWYHG